MENDGADRGAAGVDSRSDFEGVRPSTPPVSDVSLIHTGVHNVDSVFSSRRAGSPVRCLLASRQERCLDHATGALKARSHVSAYPGV